ncbi:hypothetical protein [Rhodovulum sulfidophilum]|uniref:hypothetical protein n=1 Tax=Rhodovulum sulfidophilum TaxID=35806 RepID=UPI0019247D4C|nr:hypothetical protein [Rhodovulum sulfidophilum]MBL3563044.1 hypothetical protein [Rhodovulum sulfidophilum]
MISLPFLDSISEPSVWNSCFNLTSEKRYLTRFPDAPFSLKDMDGASSSVEVVGASAIFVQWETISFALPKSEGDKFPPVEMGSASRGFALPGTSVGKYSCRWKVLEWKDSFYARRPYRKRGENSIFTSNIFPLHLPPYSGYLFRTRDEYIKFFPDRSYLFWQDLFPQINESLEHFMDNEWAGSVGGWVGDVPNSYIEEFGSDAQ